MDAITIRFRWQAAEITRLMRFRLRWAYRLQGVAVVAVVLTAGVVALVLGWPDAAGLVVPLLVLSVLYVVVAIPLLNLAAAPARRRVRERLLGTDVVVTVDDVGVRLLQGDTSVFHYWPALTRLVESPEFVILQQGRRALVSLPCRAFGDEATARRFLDTVRQHLGAST